MSRDRGRPSRDRERRRANWPVRVQDHNEARGDQVVEDEWIHARIADWRDIEGKYGGGWAWSFGILGPEYEHCDKPELACWFPIAPGRDSHTHLELVLDREIRIDDEIDQRDLDDTIGFECEIMCEVNEKGYAKVYKMRALGSGRSRGGREGGRGRDRSGDRSRDRGREDRGRDSGGRRDRDGGRERSRPSRDDDIPF